MSDSERRVGKWVGGAGAAALMAWAAYMLMSGKVPRVCRDEVASSDAATSPDDLVVRVCEPMGVTDPRVLLFLLVVFALRLPWFSEIEVAGLFRVKKQVEDAEREVRGLRESVRTAQAQVASLSATTTAQAVQSTKVEVHHHEHRGEDTGETQRTVLAGSDEAPFTEGAFAQTAFKAGLLGLPELFPVERTPAAMQFFTWGDDELELSQSVGDTNDDLAAAARSLVNPTEAVASTGSHGVLVTAPAFDDDGSTVGALVAAFRQGERVLEDPEPVFADVENVASAYARLLVDLLGETGRVISTNPSSAAHEGGR